MTDDTLLPFDLPEDRRKAVTADFDGALVLLREAERRLDQAEPLAGWSRSGAIRCRWFAHWRRFCASTCSR